MRKTVVAGLMGVMMVVAAANVAGQVSGSTTIGVPATEITTLTHGWSAKKQILSKPVYNDQSERVGEVDDIIISGRSPGRWTGRHLASDRPDGGLSDL
jgi:hypothetical protein